MWICKSVLVASRVERTGERGAGGARHASMPAAHALGLALACLDAVFLHTEGSVYLHTYTHLIRDQNHMTYNEIEYTGVRFLKLFLKISLLLNKLMTKWKFNSDHESFILSGS